MSLTPKVLAGNAGTVPDQIIAGVICKFWSHGRIKWGEEVQLGAVVSGFKDGTKCKLKIFEADEGKGENDDPVKDVEGTIDKGKVTAKYKIDFEDPDGAAEGSEYEFYFLVEIDGEVRSFRDQCPILFVDLTLPMFSE